MSLVMSIVHYYFCKLTMGGFVMKRLSVLVLFVLVGCSFLGDADPGIFGEYTTHAQCHEKD